MDDPSVAVESVSALGKFSRRDKLLQTALITQSSQDPELAWKFSERVTNRKSNELVRSKALKTMAVTRPLEAIELAETAGNSEALLADLAARLREAASE